MVTNRLVQLRKEAKLTQHELADKIGMTVSSVSMYEVGAREPSPKVLSRLAKLFDVSTDYLLGISDERNSDIQVGLNTDRKEYAQLTDEQRTQIQNVVKAMIKQYKEENNEK